MENQGDTVQEKIDAASEWVATSRIRVFGTAAGTVFVLMVGSLFVPIPLVSVLVAGILAILAIVLGLLAGATWWAERNGTTDSKDLWDTAPEDTAGVADLFTGFSPFTEDGTPSSDDGSTRQ